MRATLFFATLVSAGIGAALATPMSLEQRSSGLSCSDTIYDTVDNLMWGNSSLGMHYSDHGQLQVVSKTSDVDTLKVNMRFCNSTHLGVSENTSKGAHLEDIGHVSYGKIFLASDESKCLQRHSTLPSSNQSAKTHITIEDCSNVDDSTQARQFWHFRTRIRQILPVIKEDGLLQTLYLTMSDDSPQELLATRPYIKGKVAPIMYTTGS